MLYAVAILLAFQLAAIILGIRVALEVLREEGAATRASLEALAKGFGRVERRAEDAEQSANGAEVAAGVIAQYVRELKAHAGELVAEQRRSAPGRPRATSQPDHDELEPWSGPRAHQGSSPGL